eukprot:JP447335.1.p2 GENE.JP447335.1~~JP447335.1.p2  ORF type:complete len:74 (+),score=16.08 JP447335.1:144-365(+)
MFASLAQWLRPSTGNSVFDIFGSLGAEVSSAVISLSKTVREFYLSKIDESYRSNDSASYHTWSSFAAHSRVAQ